MENIMQESRTYFAASNSFDGFKSNFDGVFSPLKLKKLFILKGGPGTGKSTLMREVAKNFDGVLTVTNILCSSDTASLDGVLLERDGTIVAIADGTAPHVIEPRFPGAVEEIVNLGDGFDYGALMRASTQIIELSEKKSEAYKKAYSALKSAGNIYKSICDCFANNGVYKEAERLAKSITRNENKNDNERKNTSYHSDFLLGSFSKDGYTILPFIKPDKEVFSVNGDGVSEYVVMSKIAELLNTKRTLKTLYTSPLSPEMIDAIETDTEIYIVSNEAEKSVGTKALINDNSEYEQLKKAYDTMLRQAEKQFLTASSHHFALEDIYSRNVSFDKNEAKKDKIIAEVTKLFDK